MLFISCSYLRFLRHFLCQKNEFSIKMGKNRCAKNRNKFDKGSTALLIAMNKSQRMHNKALERECACKYNFNSFEPNATPINDLLYAQPVSGTRALIHPFSSSFLSLYSFWIGWSPWIAIIIAESIAHILLRKMVNFPFWQPPRGLIFQAKNCIQLYRIRIKYSIHSIRLTFV